MEEYIEKIIEDKQEIEHKESLNSRFNMLLMKNRMEKHRAENNLYKSFDEFFYIEPAASGDRRKVYIRASIDIERFVMGFMNNLYEGISIMNPAEILYYPCITCDNDEIYDGDGCIREEYYKKIKDILPLVYDSNMKNKKIAYLDVIVNDFREGYSLILLKKEHRRRMKAADFTVDDCIDNGLIFEKDVPKVISTEKLLDLIVDGIVYVENIETINSIAISQASIPTFFSADWCFHNFSEEVNRVVESY